MTRTQPSITVIIPTRDEALHIARCVDSARALGHVVVIDSGSRDRTRDIAAAHGAEVIRHRWPGHAAQKNWALDNVDITSDWVLFLDADEYLAPSASATIRRGINDPDVAAYELPRRYIFLGRELKHAWWYPDYQVRLFRRGAARYEDRRVHEHMLVDGVTRELPAAPITHENLKGLTAFIERHNRYSDLEADEILAPSTARKPGSFAGSWADRRRAAKDRLWFRLPARPLVRFLWLYVVRRGFLDGRRGLLFCLLIAMYDLMIDAKLLERRLGDEQKAAMARAAIRPHEELAA